MTRAILPVRRGYAASRSGTPDSMGKDKQARQEGRITVMALANLIGALVDTMQDEGMPPSTVLGFLDRLDRMNEVTLWGRPAEIMSGIAQVLRRTVATND